MCQKNMFRTICVLALAAFARAKPNPEEKLPVETPRTLIKDCANGIFSASCLKIEALTLIEKLNTKEELRLFPGVSIVKEYNATDNDEVTAAIAKSLENKDEKIDKFLLYKLGSYLDSHSVKLKLMDEESTEAARALVQGRKAGGGGGKKGGMGGMLAMAAMMKGGMMSMAMGGLAMIAGKALVAALMSLLLSAIVGIKSMSGGQKSTTYEIVTKPVYSHSHSHSTGHEEGGSYGGHGGWGKRSLGDRERRSIY